MEEDRLDPLEWTFKAATDPVIVTKVEGDDFPRYVLLANGTTLTGDGTANPV